LGHVVGADGQAVRQVRVALRTDSRSEALKKAAQVEEARLAEWEAIATGDDLSAREHYKSAKKLAEASGSTYVPVNGLTNGPIEDLMARVLSLADGKQIAGPEKTAAILGGYPVVLPGLREVLGEFVELTKTRHLKKSAVQRHKWLLPRQRAVRHYLALFAKSKCPVEPPGISLTDVTRQEALQFRSWWSDRVGQGWKVETANKDLGHLSQMISTWVRLTDSDYDNPFKGLRLDGKDGATVPAFSSGWVQDRLLAKGALDGLNAEARDVFLMMINTGLRPSEIIDAPVEDFVLDHEIPHLCVAPHGRELKVAHTERDIPLLGVSLGAAQRIISRGGIRRYRHKTGAWSALVNKYLANNALKETPNHVTYSLRHYVENALLAVAVDDRVRADILGHKYQRPSYGDGGGLEGRMKALRKIAR